MPNKMSELQCFPTPSLIKKVNGDMISMRFQSTIPHVSPGNEKWDL